MGDSNGDGSGVVGAPGVLLGAEARREGSWPLQGLQAGERDSCSVYGTGRIHCEQSRSVNYRRAINRAETEPRVPRSAPPLLPGRRCVQGCRGPKTSSSTLSPEGSFRYHSAWPILALAHFCLCLSVLSNHVQCQYGKSGLPQSRSPPLAPRVYASHQFPGPAGLVLGEGATLSWWAARSPYTAWGQSGVRAGQSEPGQQMELPGVGVGVTICRACFCDTTRKKCPAWLLAHPRGETSSGRMGPGLLLPASKEAIPGNEDVPFPSWIFYEGHCP